MLSANKSKSGASLLEIVVAMAILACAFLPILRIVDYGSVSTAKIGHYAKAMKLAQELIEECKHVPIATYQNHPTYKDLAADTEESIDNQFYKETLENIKKFKTESKDKLKEFACKATLKLKKNDLKQITEVWFKVEMSWYDTGSIATQKGEKRVIKVGNSYFNPELL